MYKRVGIVDPLEFANTVGDLSVQLSQVLSEELLLLLVYEVHDMVVIANDKHYVFLDYPEHLSALVELC